MKESLQATQLVRAIKDREITHGVKPVEKDDVMALWGDIQALYEVRFGSLKKVPLKLFYTHDEADVNHYMSLTGRGIPDFPEGLYGKQPRLRTLFQNGRATQVLEIPTTGEIQLAIHHANPINPINPLSVYGAISSHELFHSQAIPKNFTNGSELNPLRSEEIGLPAGARIDWATGFKTIAEHGNIDERVGSRSDLTLLLDEITTQYLSMALLGRLGDDETLEIMANTAQGITPEFIFGARLFDDIFTKLGISAVEIGALHRKSDTRGFLRLLNQKRPKLARRFLEAVTTIESVKERTGDRILLKNNTDYGVPISRLAKLAKELK